MDMRYRRCIICGERLEDESSQLCSWCKDPRFEEILRALISEVDEQLEQTPRIDVRSMPVFSLIADLGILGVRHPLLRSFAKLVAKLLVEAGKGRRELKVKEVRFGQRDIEPFLTLLHEYGIIEYSAERGELRIPETSLLLKVEAELQLDPRRNPAAAFVLGYVTLKAMLETVEQAKGGFVELGEGVMKLYSFTRDLETGDIRITRPKSFMATLAFVLGTWARGFNEFSQLDLHKFMVGRGITGKEFDEIVGLLSCAFASSHALYERVRAVPLGRVVIYRFRLNSEYARLRDRIRSRVRTA